jgi:hypothetical protein
MWHLGCQRRQGDGDEQEEGKEQGFHGRLSGLALAEGSGIKLSR